MKLAWAAQASARGEEFRDEDVTAEVAVDEFTHFKGKRPATIDPEDSTAKFPKASFM